MRTFTDGFLFELIFVVTLAILAPTVLLEISSKSTNSHNKIIPIFQVPVSFLF